MTDTFCAECGDEPVATPTGFCTSCADNATTVTGSLLGPLPPCHANGLGTKWRDPRTTTPKGRLIVDINPAPDGGIEADANQQLRVKVSGTSAALAQPAACSANRLHRDPLTNSLWVEDYPIMRRACTEVDGCEMTITSGQSDSVVDACSTAATTTIKNDSCAWPMTVVISTTLIDAEMKGGTGTYELVSSTTVGTETTTGTTKIFSVVGEPSVKHISTAEIKHISGTVVHNPTDTISHTLAFEHTDPSSIGHTVAAESISTHSGTLEHSSITLAPGESATVTFKPQFRRRADSAGNTSIDWGRLRVCLTGHSVVS
jgi:hypothetical protein